MINVEFLKTLTLLYVEDDDQVREKFVLILKKLFGKIFVAHDGLEGLQKFKQSRNDKEHIDLIISDISMPNMDGVELLSHIRKIDGSIPFIFTTAYTNTEFLLTSIEEGVTDYFVKPVDTKEIIKKVQKTCELRNKKNEVEHYQNEANKYLDVVNKVAIVSIFDKNGNFIYVNDFFIEVSQYEEKELIGKSFQIISHPDMPKEIFKKQWEYLEEGKNWKGKLKHLSKEGETFYTHTTIMPMNYNNDKMDTKYISIRFLTTKEENEKREFRRKVLYSLQETKRINQAADDKINVLINKISKYKNFDKIESKLELQKEISTKYYAKIKDLETKIVDVQKNHEKLMVAANKEIRNILSIATETKNSKETANQSAIHAKDEIKIREELIKKLKAQVDQQSKKIKDLKDVVAHRENQLEITA